MASDSQFQRFEPAKFDTAYEIIAIVVSILLAFAIDAWWEEWREGREARRIMVDLREEFVALGDQMEARQGEWEVVRADLDRLMQAGRADAPPPPAVMDTLVSRLMWTSTFDPGTGALDALLSSGRLEWIDDLELRTVLAGWPGVLREIRDNEEVAREWVALVLQPYLVQAGVPLDRSLAVQDGRPVDPASASEASEAYRRALADQGFRSHVAFRASWVNEEEYREAREALDRLMEHLQAELGG